MFIVRQNSPSHLMILLYRRKKKKKTLMGTKWLHQDCILSKGEIIFLMKYQVIKDGGNESEVKDW